MRSLWSFVVDEFVSKSTFLCLGRVFSVEVLAQPYEHEGASPRLADLATDCLHCRWHQLCLTKS